MNSISANLKRRVDSNGYFMCDEFTDEVSGTLIEVAVPEGLYKPKWDGSKWIEGDTNAAQKQTSINMLDTISAAIQDHLDKKAQEYRYDNMVSARSYTGYTNPFQTEAQKLAIWASNCWVIAGQIETDVQNGTIPMPTVADVLAKMPVYI